MCNIKYVYISYTKPKALKRNGVTIWYSDHFTTWFSLYSTYYATIIFTVQTKRDDHGDYTIIAQNEHGKVSAVCAVQVLDKPNAPVSLGMDRFCRSHANALLNRVLYLDVDNVNVTYCDLLWTAPDDDGGCELTGYQILKREQGRQKWTKLAVVECETRRYRVDDLTEGCCYDFGVRIDKLTLDLLCVLALTFFFRDRM